MNRKRGKNKKGITITSREFYSILYNISHNYGVYPNFRVRISKELYIDRWGLIVLPRIPESDFLHPDEKFYTIVSLGYHAISPRLEVNRILQKVIISDFVKQDWRSPMVSWLSGFFSTLYVLAELITNEEMSRKMRDVLYWLQNTLERVERRTALEDFFLKFIQILREQPVEKSEISNRAKSVIEILQSNLPYPEKVRSTFRILRNIITSLKSPKYAGNALKRMVIPIGKPNKNDKDTWGKNIRSEKDTTKELTPDDLAQIAKVNYKVAMNIAKNLDKKEENIEKLFKGGKLPGFSDRLRMYQKLSSTRRRIYAVRKVKMSKILLSFPLKYSLHKGMAPRGLSDWEIDDDPELLDIETSVEVFGKVIPNLSTLKRIFEYDREGKEGDSKHFEIIMDTSGSMDGKPLETAIEIALALIELAKAKDYSIAFITFSSGAWEAIPPSFDYDFVEDIILGLLADGGTNIRGALNILDEHLSMVSQNPVIFFISDTAIWDISNYTVKMRLRELSFKFPTYLIAITDELYEDTSLSLKNSGIRLVYVNPEIEEAWELVLDDFKTL